MRLWGEGTGREAGKDQQANQILEGGPCPSAHTLSKVFPDLVHLAGWQSRRLWISWWQDPWKRGAMEREAPTSGCGVCWWTNHRSLLPFVPTLVSF